MAERSVAIVHTGAANLASVLAVFSRIGVAARVTSDANDVAESAAVVLPGVGAFGAAAEGLASGGLGEALRDRIGRDEPTLAICLGFQLLAAESAESPGVVGLGVFESAIEPVPAEGLAVPHLGWNRVRAGKGCALLESDAMYFANSFALVQPPPGWASATTVYGERFTAAVERGRVLACQFHPELSGPAGRSLIERWLVAARLEPAAC
ncbi:MAG: imidazole glycerol phosphate synthase subunit HisH [Planctomycetota bacterium]